MSAPVGVRRQSIRVALSATLGPAIGVPAGLGLAVVWGLTPGQKC